VSLTEALRAGAPEAFGVLYDEHAEQLYAYCHIMVGDEAADAVRDAFIAVARHPGTAPADDAALPVWLHALARAECVRRGALVRKIVEAPSADPLRRALARLRPEHREVLALSTALRPDEIARVVGVARDTARMLVRLSRTRLEQAAASVLTAPGVRDEAMLDALDAGDLEKLVTRGYEPPPRQRERVLFSCAAAERAADGALLFDQDGMPIPLDGGLSGTAEEPTHPFTVVAWEQPAIAPPREGERVDRVASGPSADRDPGVPTVRITHARPEKETFLSRRREGLLEVAGLAACVAAATSVLALWPSPHGNGASTADGSSLFVHHGATASRSVLPAPPASAGTPPQAVVSKPGVSPSASPTPSPTKTAAAPTTTTPSASTTPTAPGTTPPSNGGPILTHPKPPEPPAPPASPSEPPTTTPTPTPTPTPSDSPTHKNDEEGGDSPTPDPSGS
jgi:DNA-directed RNA polymerase specialized sigma24 family protein